MFGRLADVREGEGAVVLRSLLALFGLVAAHTILETARDTMFLQELAPDRLTLAYALLALLTLIASWLSVRLIRAFGRRSTTVFTLMVASYGTLVFYFQPSTPARTFLLYVWCGLVASVAIVQFWLLAGQLFTITQGKRLFGPIAAGGVLGAAAGAGAAAAALTVLPVRSLLLGAAVIYVITAVLLTYLPTDESRAPSVASPPPPGLAREDLSSLRRTPYLGRIAAVIALSTAALMSTDYLFKSTAAARLEPDALGPFFATFYATVNAVALVVQLFVVERVLRRFGVAASLAVLPALLLLGGLGTAALGAPLLLVLLTKGADGALRHSLHRVAMELSYTPLPAEVRDRSKALLDTVWARAVQGLAAGLILALVVTELASPPVLAALVAGLSAAWLVAAAGLRRGYLDLFRQALRRSAGRPHLRQLDMDSLAVLIEALSSPDHRTVIGALDLLGEGGRQRFVPGLVLYHESEDVLLRALEILSESQRTDWVPLAERLLAHASETVRLAAVRSLRRHPASVRRALLDSRPSVRALATFSLARDEGSDPRENPAIRELLQATGDDGRDVRIAFLKALTDRPDPRWADLVLAMCEARDPALTPHAAAAAAELGDARFIPLLIARLGVRDGRGAVRDALVKFGEPALDLLDRSLGDPDVERRVRVHIPRTISRFASQRAADVLSDRLRTEPDGLIRFKVLRGLGRLVAATDVKVDRALIEAEMGRNLIEHLRVLSLIVPLKGSPSAAGRREAGGKLVIGMLEDKLHQSLERAFRLLQIAHRREDIESVHSAARSADPKARANALEFLDTLILAAPGGPAGQNRQLLRIAVDDLPATERITRAAPFIPIPPRSEDEAIAALLGDDDESLAALAAYHAVESGRPTLRERVLTALAERPSLRLLGAQPIAALADLTGPSHAG